VVPHMRPPKQTASPAVIGWMPVRGAPGVEHLAVAGELCLSTSGDFETAVSAVREDALLVVLDLSAVTCIDSSGIRVILRAADRFRAAGRRLVLLNDSRVIRRLFELAGVDDDVEFVSRSAGRRALAPARDRGLSSSLLYPDSPGSSARPISARIRGLSMITRRSRSRVSSGS
jgi:anti-anti-sigma factor